jgi:hypothetical protein
VTSEWGWNPATFEALGTVGATCFAAVAALLAVMEQRQVRRASLERHAMAVSAYEIERGVAVAGEVHVTIGVRNSGSMPIYGLLLAAWHSDANPSSVVSEPAILSSQTSGRFLWFGSEFSLMEFEYNVVLPPETTARVDILLCLEHLIGNIRSSIGIAFRDCEGRRWIRTLDGRLIPRSVTSW